ncbi:hemolysin family protein [Myxococcota bacterium]|nr:hemolysin family protein [Myxococcota bacterium]
MTVISSVLFVFLLIAVNALFVAGEFGAVSARRTRIWQLASEGNTLARRLAPVLDDPALVDRWVAACQLGITASSLVLGAYGQAKLSPVLTPMLEQLGVGRVGAESTAAVVVLIGLTIVQMVLGELVPKSIALQYPTQTALFTSLPLAWSVRAFSRAIDLFNGSARVILRLLHIPIAERRQVHSAEEISMMITESSSGGLLDPEAKDHLIEALRLEMRDARHLMRPRGRIEALELEADEDEVARALVGPYTRLPVYRGRFDDIVGVLHTKDAVLKRLRTGRIGPLAALMRPPLFVRDTDRADRILAALREQHTTFALVRDRVDVVVGIVTLEDVLTSVFGDLRDELAPAREARLHDRSAARRSSGRLRWRVR